MIQSPSIKLMTDALRCQVHSHDQNLVVLSPVQRNELSNHKSGEHGQGFSKVGCRGSGCSHPGALENPHCGEGKHEIALSSCFCITPVEFLV